MVCLLPPFPNRKFGLQDTYESELRGFLAGDSIDPDMEEPAEEKDTTSSVSKLPVRLHLRTRALFN